jgi:methyl-accepting chemotaxis protein
MIGVLLRQELKAKMDALDKSQAVIEFKTDGTIIKANANFLAAMGYSLDEIAGQHHSLFVKPGERDSTAYREFWEALRRGEHRSGEFHRLAKGGRDVWIQASYNPIMGRNGKPVKVVKFAADVTAQKREALAHEGMISAIEKSQAVIQFAMDGTIITANENFLQAVGYRLDEIQGRHHSMFVTARDKDSAAYPTGSSGRRSTGVNTRADNTSAAARPESPSGCRRATTPSSISTADPPRW